MSIQEKIASTLDIKMKSKVDYATVNILKFLKAELQRGKNKIVNDEFAIPILLKIIKDQSDLVKKLATGDSYNKRISNTVSEAVNLINETKKFLQNEVVIQLDLSRNDLIIWIEQNIDFSSLKNPGQAIGIVKKKLPYADGNLIKEAMQTMLAKS